MEQKTDLEIQEQAESFVNDELELKENSLHRHDCIVSFLAGAKWMQERDKWISVDALPAAGTECYFVVQFTNEFGIQNVQHTGIFGALGFTSYHDSENYSIKEVTKHLPLPSPPKTK